MLNQKLIGSVEASEPPLAVREPDLVTALNQPAAGLILRAKSIAQANTGVSLTLLAAEHTAVHIVELPKASARQQTAMMRFAVEELIAQPLDQVVVSMGPTHRSPSTSQIAIVTSTFVLDQYIDITGLFPEFLMIPPPQTDETWNVWREGVRAVVRASDGVGFAVPMTLLSVIWGSVGRPQIFSLADQMPPEFAATDQSENPPAPLPQDLAFRFASDHARETKGMMRTALFTGAAILIAAIVQLAFFAIETRALGQQAAIAQNEAQIAIADTLPGVALTEDISAILNRLSPAAAAPRRGAFLPMLADVSDAIAATSVDADTPVGFRRLAWGAQDDRLVLLVQTGGLDDLQRVQQGLQAVGFSVTTGAANASEGGAEAEMRITRRGTQ